MRGVFELIAFVGILAIGGCAPAAEVSEEATGVERSGFEFNGWSTIDLDSQPVLPTGTAVSRGKGVATPATRHKVGDRVRFLYQSVADPRSEIVIKVVGLSATPGEPPVSPPQGQVGVMIRDGLGADARMVAGYWERNSYTAEGLVMNKFRVTWREEKAPSDVTGPVYEVGDQGQSPTWAEPSPDAPIWLRLQRQGNGVALSRSFDGSSWSPMSDTFGGADFFPAGPAYLGVFVAGFDPPNDASGGDSPTTTTADIADVAVRDGAEVDYGYRTTWIGGTENRSVPARTPGVLSALYVAPNGTAYTYGNGDWNSARRTIHDASTGMVRQPALQDVNFEFGAEQNAFTGDGTWVYFVSRGGQGFCVLRYVAADLGDVAPPALDPCVSATHSVAGRAGGAAAYDGQAGLRVYVTDFDNGRVHVFGAPLPGSSQLALLSSFPVHPRPGAVAVGADGERVWVVHSATAYGALGSYDQEPNLPAGTPSIKAYDPLTSANVATIPVCPSTPANVSNCPPPNAGGMCVTNPTALAYDRWNDRLLVAENGPSQNIHFFCSLDQSTPTRCTPASFGQEGGVFCGTPGKVTDGGSDARFHALAGVGVDETGAITVASSGPYYDVRKYAANGNRMWANQGLLIGSIDFDPASDGLDVYSVRQHFKLNLGDGTAPEDQYRKPTSPEYKPGSEWSFEGVTWDPFPDPLNGSVAYAEKDEHNATARPSGAPLVRRIGGIPYMFVAFNNWDVAAAAGFGPAGSERRNEIRIYRFLGERAVPSGAIRVTNFCDWPSNAPARVACDQDPACLCRGQLNNGQTIQATGVLSIWNDTNANGLEDEMLDTTMPDLSLLSTFSEIDSDPWNQAMIANPPPSEAFAFDVDTEGDLWLSFDGDKYDTEDDVTVLARAAIWRLERDRNSSQIAYAVPTAAQRQEYAVTPLGISSGSLRFHPQPSESMYIHAGNVIHRVDSFLSPERALALSIPLPIPPLQSEVVRSDFSRYGSSWKYFDVAGDKVFVAEFFGPVSVYDANTGGFVTRLFANADVSGFQTENDNNLRAFKRSNGEYLVTEQDTGGRGRALLFRWTPPSGCVADGDCQGPNEYCDAGTCRARSCSLSDPFGSMSPVLAAGLNADGIAIAPNRLSAVISSKSGSDYQLFSVTRQTVSEPFGSPVALDPLNTNGDERSPWLSADGRRLYFHRPGSVGGTDLFVATRPSPASEFLTDALVADANSALNDEDPFLLPGEGKLFFSSSRGPGTDLYVASASGTGFLQPTRLGDAVNSAMYADTRPVVTRDGLSLYFHSQRLGVGNDTDGDIWLAPWNPATNDFGTPENVSLLNTSGIDFPVSLSADGCSLYLASNRELGLGSTQAFRLYQAQRQASPSQVTVTMNVVGGGSVGAPFNCSANGGTCTAQGTFGDSLIVWASSSATWSGNCGPNGTGLSTDGIVPFTLNSTCTVTFSP
jgi:hypothetical protein